jgi:hypothetical protein
MATYWITFRIADHNVGNRTYDDRYKDLQGAVRLRASKWWIKPTSFIAFASEDAIGAIAQACKDAIAPMYDLFLIREMDTKSAIICGNNDDDDIYLLMPYLKKL